MMNFGSAHPRIAPRGLTWLLCAACWFAVGCQSVAPIHVWAPPRIGSAVGKRIAIAPISGEPGIAQPLHAAMIRALPADVGGGVEVIDTRRLEEGSPIRLVSFDQDEPSDIALVNLARNGAIDLLLCGEVLQVSGPANGQTDRRTGDAELVSTGLDPATVGPAMVGPGDRPGLGGIRRRPAVPTTGDLGAIEDAAAAEKVSPRETILRMSWKLIDTKNGAPLNGMPLVTAARPGESEEDLIGRAAREAWELLVPHVVRDETELANQRLGSGVASVRQGNVAAGEGDWSQAERHWQAALETDPRSHAAMHNLAVAAVARQDFPEARRRIGEALGRRSLSLYRSTAVWIELRQRQYHRAFELPDPPEGWAATRGLPD
ncbi:MAG: hypothetical protein EA381_12030 [Planctomycetaceae bacterium]|nr:MAG: hypothetical protein EA381_12030 [Planctomycetaceae bacterium]